MADKKKYQAFILEHADLFTDVSDKIWEFAELSLQEHRSADLYCDLLTRAGFTVERPYGGIETAFRASFGTGKPVIGILAEYDALSGLSQAAGETHHKPLDPNGTGHGCGHNLLGAGSLAAAMGIQAYLKEHGTGTVVFYGCPGEEGGASKAFFARDGLWKELDAALTWHPDDVNQVPSGTCNTSIQTEYRFTGIASHAAGNPEMGRSALDAVELMNMGVQFLREHMPSGARVHYAITDAGGCSPNVVQPKAQVLYMVRSMLGKDALALQARVDRIAEGAAMMTDTKLEKHFIDATSNTVPNRVLEELVHRNFSEAQLPDYTQAERDFAKAIVDSYEMPTPGLPGQAAEVDPEAARWVDEMTQGGKRILNDFLMPYRFTQKQSFGSTDVGDVSWLVPTVQLNALCWPSKAPGHSWQNVSCGKTSLAHKGLLLAGQVMCASAIDLYEDPALLAAAKAEFAERTKDGFFCPVPKDAVPTIAGRW